MAGRFSVEAVFKAVDRLSAPVTRMQRRIDKFTKSFRRGLFQLNRMADKLARGVKRLGLAAAAGLLVMGTAMADVVNTGADFEQTLVNAAAKFPEGIRRGTEAFQQLEQIARQTGATTEFTASQAAQGLNFLAMAGFNAEQSIAALPAVVDLATAAQVDLGVASDIATDSLGAFNLATKDAAQLGKNLARVNDVMAKTVTSANTNMEELFETIKDGGPVATGAGASIETFNALAGQLANAGIKGSKAGTTLKNMFLRLSAPAAAGAKALSALGVRTKDADGNMRDIVDIIGELEKGLEGVGSADRAKVLNDIFGLRAVAGSNVLLSVGANRLREYRRELVGAGGAASGMADVMRDTVRGRMLTFQSAVESVKISLFTLRKNGITRLIERGTDLVRNIDSIINSNEELANQTINDVIQKVMLATKVFAGLIATVVLLKTVVLVGNAALITYKGTLLLVAGVTKAWAFANAMLTKGLVALRAAVFAVSVSLSLNPIGAVVLAVAALIAGIVLLVRNWGLLKEKFLSFSKPVQAALTIAFLPLVLLARAIRGSIDLFQRMKPVIADVMSFIGEKISSGVDTMKTSFTSFFSLFGGVGEAVLSVFDRVGAAISGVIGAVASSPILSGVIDSVAKFGRESLFGRDATASRNGLTSVGDLGPAANDSGGQQAPSVVTPQERVARTIEENRKTNTAELTIKDETGRGELKQSNPNNSTSIKLASSGGL